MKLSYPMAVLLSQMAIDQAESMDIPMVVALADDQGDMMHFVRMNGALPASSAIATNKAYTAAALRMATHDLGRLAQPGGVLYGIQHALEGRAVLFGGGYPLRVNNAVVGALGISGGSVEQDMQVARAVLAVWERMLTVARALAPIVPEEVLARGQGRRRFLNEVLAGISQGAQVLPAAWQNILSGALLLLCDLD